MVSEGSGCGWADGGGGGGTEKRARSWVSVSRIREVISWLERRALVNILGGGKLFMISSLQEYESVSVECIREAVNALTGYGDLLQMRRKERHSDILEFVYFAIPRS